MLGLWTKVFCWADNNTEVWASPYRPGVNESRTADLVAKPTRFANIEFGFAQSWCTVMGKMNGNYLQLPFSTLQGHSTL